MVNRIEKLMAIKTRTLLSMATQLAAESSLPGPSLQHTPTTCGQIPLPSGLDRENRQCHLVSHREVRCSQGVSRSWRAVSIAAL